MRAGGGCARNDCRCARAGETLTANRLNGRFQSRLRSLYNLWLHTAGQQLVSPASLLDSQHGCITSPHAKKESGQTPLAVWSPLVQEFLGQGSGFDCCGVWFLFIFADSATTFADSARPNCQRSLTRLLLRVR